MKRILHFFAILVSAFVFNIASSSAQIVITPSVTAAVLANKLVGSGVVIIAPTLTCPAVANGTFVGPSSLSFDTGIVLTSGRAQTAGLNIGAGGPASGFASTSNSAPGDAQLTALAGQPTFDACILEFDFRPAGDTVKFNYVFGSEEYTSYTCSSFNDVFGFFISGPGYGAPTNIALVPGTTVPVCINSVNCGPTGGGSLSTCTAIGPGSPFCTYYVNNSAGATITYDGLTTTLQAVAHVVPCDTYHLKIGIADGTDHVLDSGVFIEAGSLSSTGFSINSHGINSTDTATGGQYCIRGCLPGQFVFHTSAPVTTNTVIHYVIGGTAVNGTDYTTIADSVTILAGGTADTLFIHPLVITPAGGPKTVKLFILSPYSCGGTPTIIDSAILNIYDGFYVHIITPDTTICQGQHVFINTTGDPTLSYSWAPSGTLNSSTLVSPTATPVATTTYVVSAVLPGTGCPATTDSIIITVVHPFSLDIGAPIKNTCVGVALPLHLTVNATSPGTYQPVWSPATYLAGATTNDPIVTPVVAGDVMYYVSDTETSSHCFAVDSFLLHVLPNDFSLFNPDSTMCFSGIVPIRASGDTEFSYHWTPAVYVNNPNIINPIATITSSTVLTVTGSYPGCPDMIHTVNFTIEAPNVDIRTGDTAFCIGDSILLDVVATNPGSSYTLVWTPTTYLANATTLTPTFSSPIVGDFLYNITITSPLGCVSTDHVTLSPRPPANITVTPANTMVNYGDQVQLDAINLTPYPLIFWWTPSNGSLDNSNINNPIATLTDSTTFVAYAMNQWGCRDSASVTILVNNGSSEVIPTAFTPNGDGLNDVFRILNLRYQKIVLFEVFNRWGEKVFENNNTNDGKKGWDGTYNGVKQDMGVYYYQIIVAKPDGNQKMYKGEVTLIR